MRQEGRTKQSPPVLPRVSTGSNDLKQASCDYASVKRPVPYVTDPEMRYSRCDIGVNDWLCRRKNDPRKPSHADEKYLSQGCAALLCVHENSPAPADGGHSSLCLGRKASYSSRQAIARTRVVELCVTPSVPCRLPQIVTREHLQTVVTENYLGTFSWLLVSVQGRSRRALYPH